MATSTTVSAPGKILLAGGYLVLESENAGLVVAADKRFYTTVAQGEGEGVIVVTSPQFHAAWKYSLPDGTPDPGNPSSNPFVEKALQVSLLYLQPASKASINITIRADNDFYSILPHLPKDQPRTPEAVSKLDKFLNCPVDKDGKAIVNKTGLGSSAALTTSLVGALVHYYKGNSSVIHNLAQICHCHAQGKVGSGFDVSSAMHGTHVYKRFPKCLLPDLLQQLEAKQGGRDTLVKCAETVPWKEDMVTPLELPKGQLQILLADVCGGSESPSMAKKVLQWKQQQSSPIPHWDDLKALNAQAIEIMHSLKTAQVDYDSLAILPASKWPSESPLMSLHTTFVQIREHLKKMGDASGAPIEPDEQTKLCDATCALPGVVAAVVPGAGGYDAVVCLYIDRPSVLKEIGTLWSEWENVCPLAVQASAGGLQVETNFEC